MTDEATTDLVTRRQATLAAAALAAHRAGRLAEAEVGYRAALAADPADADAAGLLGVLLQGRRGHADEAAGLLTRAVELDPAAPNLRLNLGNCLARLGRPDEALAQFGEAVRLRPGYAEAWRNLGRLLGQLGRWADAAEAYRRLTLLAPDDVEACLLHGSACRQSGRPGAALVPLNRAVRLDPDHAGAWHLLASALGDLGRGGEAADAFARAAAADPTNPLLGSDALHLLHYDAGRPAASLRAAAVAWAAKHADPVDPLLVTGRDPFPHVDRDPNRRLRVGLVSGDLREHPVGRVAPAVLQHLDRAAFAVTCYDDSRPTKVSDPVAALLRSIGGIDWVPTAELSDADLADRVRGDGVDVLIDWSGHMGSHRLTAFARRPAPAQVTHFNYPGTTGMAAVGWRLTDDLSEPPGADDDAWSVERLVRLGPCGWCYDPGEDTPPVGPPPSEANGFVTFCSLNKPLKHSAATVALWTRVLRAVPGSKLLLLGWADEREDAMLYEPFAAHGVGRERLVFAPRGNRNQYLDQYNRADVALDPFPYNGGVTTCDALHMGVPVVALAGDSYRARQGQMLLTNVGLPELAAATEDEYVRLAVALAADAPRRAALRATLRDRLAGSVVCDGPAFAARFGAALRAMWRD